MTLTVLYGGFDVYIHERIPFTDFQTYSTSHKGLHHKELAHNIFYGQCKVLMLSKKRKIKPTAKPIV